MDGLAVHPGSARYASTHQTEIHDLKLCSLSRMRKVLSAKIGATEVKTQDTDAHTHIEYNELPK